MLIRYRLEYYLLQLVIILFKITPYIVRKFLLKVIFYFVIFIDRKHREILDINLSCAFKDKSLSEIKNLKKDIKRHFFEVIFFLFEIFIKDDLKKVMPKFIIEGEENLKESIVKSNEGVILFSAHYGNWELIPYILKTFFNIDVYGVARKFDNPFLEKMIMDFRKKIHTNIIYNKNVIREILKSLEMNRVLYFLIDQNVIDREGVYVDFFDQKACAVSSLAKIHLKYKTPIIPIFLQFSKDKRIATLKILNKINYIPQGDKNLDIKEITQKCTSIIEEQIKSDPSQWLWFHNRWRLRSNG